MTRIIGFFLLQGASVLFSLQYNGKKKRQLAAMTSFAELLRQLRGILEADAPPMPELLHTLAQRSNGEASAFAERLLAAMDKLGRESFHTLWSKALRENAPPFEDCILPELEALGAVLGRYDLDTQLEAVESCQTLLLRDIDKRREALPQSVRLTFGLLISATLMLGILLI